MKTTILILISFLVIENIAFCDNIYIVNSVGGKTILAKDVIIVKINNNSFDRTVPIKQNEIEDIDYYFWNSRANILEEVHVHIYGDKYYVEFGTKEKQKEILMKLRNNGIHAEITTTSGGVYDLYCLKVIYGAPEGYVVMVPFGQKMGRDDDTILDLYINNDKLVKIDLSEITTIEYKADILTVVKKNKQMLNGKWKGPLLEGKEQKILIKGVDTDGFFQTIKLKEIISFNVF